MPLIVIAALCFYGALWVPFKVMRYGQRNGWGELELRIVCVPLLLVLLGLWFLLIIWVPQYQGPRSAISLSSGLAMKLLMAMAAFFVSFGFSSYFLAEFVLPWPRDSFMSRLTSFGAGICLSVLFAVWLYRSEALGLLLSGVTGGFLGMMGSVIAILFLAMGVFLFFRKIKAFFQIRSK